MVRTAPLCRLNGPDRDERLQSRAGPPMPRGMDEALRPDLSRILPQPWLRRPPPGPPLGDALIAPEPADDADFVVAVRRPRDSAPDEVGFGLAQATAVADRLAAVFAQAERRELDALHRPTAPRVQDALLPPSTRR